MHHFSSLLVDAILFAVSWNFADSRTILRVILSKHPHDEHTSHLGLLNLVFLPQRAFPSNRFQMLPPNSTGWQKKRKKEKKKRIRANEKFQDVAWISTRWTKNNAEKAARVELLIYTRTWPAWMDPSSCNWCHVQPKCCLHALPSNAIRFSLRV